ncbi:uncharacterized protein N7515_008325 [Penicillium bovifimosum]|uniref:FAD-binding domain-containing protein n=1 Tax=Penicillium bovifimosum TaxID=126998 RepID=A0A9W9GPB6_9EURO|nr:uncharacterized protein N7515_008325 [Penicillium bovifimosum]KAJ5124500.1 hypothetical protein N7515_008325 [Penicillium bovifimosum]
MTTNLNILIVGAGLSGLATAISAAQSGHKIQVLEQAKALTEIGAGLQITPQRLPPPLPLEPPPNPLDSRRTVLACDANFSQNIRSKYQFPFVDLHRGDLQKALYTRAQELGVVFHFGQRVERIDFENTVVHTSGGEYTGNLIVAADGLWSRCREEFVGRKDEPIATGDLAYRIVLDVGDIEDAGLREMVQRPEVRFWIGDGAHVVAYSLRGGRMFNVVLLVPDTLPEGVAREAGNVEEMRRLFVGWDPILNRFLECVTTVDKWKLMHHGEMEHWVNEASNLVFIGDACHPMLPYLAQGANSSLEDGAVLGMLLGHMTDKAQLPRILRLYESMRKSRGEAIVRETFKQRHDFHMPDGEEQRKRDHIFLSQLGKEIKGAFPSRWTCPEVQPWLYGYNAIKEVEEAVAQNPDVFGTK